MLQYFHIRGIGHYFPENRVTAEDADQRSMMPLGWTMKKVGVSNRFECRSPESVSSMAVQAVHRALESASLDWSSIDLIIDASTCRQQPIPCNAALLQKAFGESAEGIPCFDIQSTCLGFMVALNVANGLLATGMYNRILIINSEAALAGVYWKHPESAALMGDGAAAVVLERRSQPLSGFGFMQQTFSEFLSLCQIRGGGHSLPVFEYDPSRENEYRFSMDGPGVFKIARKKLPVMVQALLSKVGRSIEELEVIPHQASPMAVEAMRRVLGAEASRFQNRVCEQGNNVSASIPIVLSQMVQEGRIPIGQNLLLLGTSAGYSQAACIFQW